MTIISKTHDIPAIKPQITLDLNGLASPGPLPSLRRTMRSLEEGQVLLRVLVDDSRCVGCGACVVQAPSVFRLDERGKAEVHDPVQTWSPIDGNNLLTFEEWAVTTANRFKGADRDGNLQLTPAEFRATAPKPAVMFRPMPNASTCDSVMAKLTAA